MKTLNPKKQLNHKDTENTEAKQAVEIVRVQTHWVARAKAPTALIPPFFCVFVVNKLPFPG
ncbi:MAG: hypothetical protein IV089_10760 [Thiobacillus sp.]|nr:hypothetical protein [Thiobacillus sp.]